jgi:hypothetical protein
LLTISNNIEFDIAAQVFGGGTHSDAAFLMRLSMVSFGPIISGMRRGVWFSNLLRKDGLTGFAPR